MQVESSLPADSPAGGPPLPEVAGRPVSDDSVDGQHHHGCCGHVETYSVKGHVFLPWDPACNHAGRSGLGLGATPGVRGQTVVTMVPAFSSAVTSSAGAVVSVTRVCRRVEGPT